MLVILRIVPTAAPGETMLNEQFVAEVVLIDKTDGLVLLVDAVMGIALAVGWLYEAGAGVEAGVVAGVDVDGKSLTVVRQFLAAGNLAEVEAGSVVVGHGAFVVGIVFINESHLLYTVTSLVELAEDVEQVLGNGFVADELTHLGMTVLIDMQHAEVAQVIGRHGAVALEGLEPDALEYLVSDGGGGEATVDVDLAQGGGAEHLAGLPLLSRLCLTSDGKKRKDKSYKRAAECKKQRFHRVISVFLCICVFLP